MHRFSAFAAIAALATICAPAASAASVVIWPIDPTLAPTEKATVLWIENQGNDPVTMQVRALAWSQIDGEDRLADQGEVIASPPIATIAPRARQLVRLVRRSAISDQQEDEAQSAYRLLIDELPAPEPQSSEATTAAPRLSVQMRYSLPLFAYSAAPDAIAPYLETRIVTRDGTRQLAISNRGAEHARLTDLTTANGAHPQSVKPGLVGYVLPGATLYVPVTPGMGDTMQVTVNGTPEVIGPKA
ncbi:MAG: fimbria/pilus periplasmic chaperone [Erythrobacter sp.]|nr:fimbria/pilus periplasmic chaperone [Erythrobacter sp.]